MPVRCPSPLPVVCALGTSPAFRDWFRTRVRRDRRLSRRIDLTLPKDNTSFETALEKAVVCACYRFSEDRFRRARSLKWLHLGVAGVDSVLFPALRKSRVVMTSSVGLHAESVPQAAWAFVLSFATGLHEGYRQQQQGRWDRKAIVLKRTPLSHQRILIIGTGHIGRAIARLARHAGMEVWGIRRSCPLKPVAHFDRVLTPRGLRGALAWADYVVLAVPGGAATRHMIGARELHCMKPTAYLVNVARGSVVDERALITALRKKTIAGAGLDVFDTEPLPSGHPFYTLPNVAMTPHTSGDTADYSHRAADLFLRNLRRYLAGRSLINVVDKRRGY